MRKIIFLFLSVIIAIFILYSNTDKYIKANKVYTKQIDLKQDANKIAIDNTRVIEKSEKILNDIYGIEDFSEFKIESDFGDNVFYVYFLNKNNNGYFISYNIDKGVVVTLSKLSKDRSISEEEAMSLEDLEETIRTYLDILEVSNSYNYRIISNTDYGDYLEVKLDNKLTQNEIKVTVNIYTGELIEYDFSKMNTTK